MGVCDCGCQKGRDGGVKRKRPLRDVRDQAWSGRWLNDPRVLGNYGNGQCQDCRLSDDYITASLGILAPIEWDKELQDNRREF